MYTNRGTRRIAQKIEQASRNPRRDKARSQLFPAQCLQPGRDALALPGTPVDADGGKPQAASMQRQAIQESVGGGIVTLPGEAEQGGTRAE